MTMFKTTTPVLCLALLSACAGSEDSPVPPVGAYRAEIAADLGLTDSMPPEQVAALAREWVYTKNHPLPDTPATLGRPGVDLYRALRDGQERHWCMGMAHVLAWMLEELGIPARQVALATPAFFAGAKFETHDTVEVFVGRWVVHDPSFNVTYQCAGGDDAGITDLFQCQDAVTWRYGKVVYAERTLEAYPVPFKDHLYGYHFFASKLNQDAIDDYPFTGWYR